ncbi:MAG: FliM/FliN family flagellar motor switch protein [Granulosicoccus sp.]
MTRDSTTKTATIYDFTQPSHKLNAQWPILDLLSSRIAVDFAKALSSKLQISLNGTASGTTRSKYSECVASMGNTCIVYELTMSPIQGTVWFCMDTSVLTTIVDAYFGGNANLVPEDEPRELSRTEIRVADHVVNALVTGVNQGWSIAMPVKAASLGVIDVERLKNAPMDQLMVNSEINLILGTLSLPFQLVYPFESLKPFTSKLRKEAVGPSNRDAQFSHAMQGELMNCEIDIRGVLSEMPITLRKLLELKSGDFIPLRDVQTVSFKTQGMPLFDARIGSTNGRVSASVSRWHLPVKN